MTEGLLEIIHEARRTGWTGEIVEMLRAGPLSDKAREMLADLLAERQLKRLRGNQGLTVAQRFEARRQERPIREAIQKHIDAGDLVKVAIGKVSDALGRDVTKIWKHPTK